MKTKHTNILLGLMLICTLSGCNNYIDIMPKGKAIPDSYNDYAVMLNYEYGVHYTPVLNSLYLLNDLQVNVAYINSNDLRRANYMWDESADRVLLNVADESTYYNNYSAISTCNLLIEHMPEITDCTDAQRNEVIAQAKIIRALSYYNLVNFYSKQYDAATAATDGGVPVIKSANVNAPSIQLSVQEVYDFILSDINEAIKGGLQETSDNILRPTLAAAYALLARTYLTMGNYSEALTAANEALKRNDALFDWNAYYDKFQANIEDPQNFTNMATPQDYGYVENYYFRSGDRSPNYGTNMQNLPQQRGELFEEGDAKFMSIWKLRTVGQDTYYKGNSYGFFNLAGLTTAEVYLIKAECLARTLGSSMQAAMDVLNAVRVTRIRPEVYQPAEAANQVEAIKLIRRTKDNELIHTIVPFVDARRLNAEGTYANSRVFSKVVDGVTYTLSPTSHLWIMPFPAGATKNTGNGTITQNVEK